MAQRGSPLKLGDHFVNLTLSICKKKEGALQGAGPIMVVAEPKVSSDIPSLLVVHFCAGDSFCL